jgi:hypothetical protein
MPKFVAMNMNKQQTLYSRASSVHNCLQHRWREETVSTARSAEATKESSFKWLRVSIHIICCIGAHVIIQDDHTCLDTRLTKQ